MTGGGLRFPKEPPPPGRRPGLYALAVALLFAVLTFACVADRLDFFR